MLLSFVIEENPCRTPVDSTIIREIKQVVRERFDIRSFKCKYNCNSGSHYSDEVWLESFDFIYKEGNFKISNLEYLLCEEEDESINSLSEPKNLLEVFIYQREKEKQKERSMLYSSRKNIAVQTEYYFYNGKGEERNIWIDKAGENKIRKGNSSEEAYSIRLFRCLGDPRLSIGYIGIFVFPPLGKNKLRILDFLEESGPFYITEKEGNTVLWHEINFSNYGIEIYSGEKYAFEIWFDRNRDIVKILDVWYPSRHFGLEKVKSVIGDKATCDFPEFLIAEYEFYDYRDFEGGVRIPLRVVSKLIRYEGYYLSDPEVEKELKRLEDNFSVEATIKRRSLLQKTYIAETSEYRIDENSIVINQPIADDEFIAPPVTEEEPVTNRGKGIINWLNRYKLYVFISGCVLFTFIAMFITKRYWGWGE